MSAPLAGRVVVVTRPREEAEDLARPLRELGAEVLLAPAIRIEPGDVEALRAAVAEASGRRFDWVAFTSAAGVRAWFGHADGPPASRVAAVGPGTAEALRSHGLEPDLVPRTFTTEELGRAFPDGPGRVLLPRADIASPGLREALEGKGWTVVPVDAYRTRFENRLPEAVADALTAGRVDAVTFTSASSVAGFGSATTVRPAAACLGPVTAEAARREGFPVAAVAEPHTIDGLVQAVLRLLARSTAR
jgi:uroporphyrinogen III methyltransferase / synthase